MFAAEKQPQQQEMAMLSTTTSMPTSSDGRSTPKAQQRILSINEQDADVLMAVRALGDMRNQRISPGQSQMNSPTSPYMPPTDGSSGPSYSTYSMAPPGQEYPLPNTSPEAAQASNGPDFVSRVSNFPLVNTAIQVYERGKSSSRVVKYGAEMMESSVRSISKPVIDRLPVAQMDDFACRQLDRLEGRRKSFSQSNAATPEAPQGDWELNTPTSMKHMYSQHTNPSTLSLQTQATYSTVDGSITSSMPPLTPSTTRGDADPSPQQQDVQQSGRGGWQTMFVGASGLTAAVSDENMHRLQFCLRCLKWATEISEQQIAVLRNFLASLSMARSVPQADSRTFDPEMAPISPTAARTLAQAQNHVVEAIKRVIDVVSTSTGSALPEPARVTVRRWILELPQRWQARAVREQEQAEAAAFYRRGSYSRQNQAPPPQIVTRDDGNLPTVGAAKSIATRVLTLALESLDMLQAVTKVFNESLESAEAWLDRLRTVGLRPEDPASQQQQSPETVLQHQQMSQTPSNMSSQANTPSIHTAPYGSYPWSSSSSVTSGKPEYMYYGYAASSAGQEMPYLYAKTEAAGEVKNIKD